MEYKLQITEKGVNQKLSAIKEIKELLKNGLYHAKCILDNSIKEGCIILEFEKRPKNTELLKFTKVYTKPRRKFPREMMVSMDKKNWSYRVVIGKIKTDDPFLTRWPLGGKGYIGWKYAKEIN